MYEWHSNTDAPGCVEERGTCVCMFIRQMCEENEQVVRGNFESEERVKAEVREFSALKNLDGRCDKAWKEHWTSFYTHDNRAYVRVNYNLNPN